MDVTRESSDKKHIIHPFYKSPPKKDRTDTLKKINSFFFLFFFGLEHSETFGVLSKLTKDCINHIHLETPEHITEVWK